MKVAIVGTSPDSVNDAPYDNNSWQIWSLGSNALNPKRFNRWFELHHPEVLKAAKSIDDRRVNFFKTIGKDLYVAHASENWPQATLYPKDEIVAKYGNYFTSSIAWMIALAIEEGAEEIGLWGINMIGENEYSQQRACCEHLLGIAKGRGIKVTISPKSPLLRSERMYAFEYHGLSAEIQNKIAETNEVLAKCDADYLAALEKRAYTQGVAMTLKEFERRWG